MEISDEELTAEALAADPDAPITADAVSLWQLVGDDDHPLPDWYMPVAPASGPRTRVSWHRPAALLVIGSFVGINVCGLCNTYGQILLGH